MKRSNFKKSAVLLLLAVISLPYCMFAQTKYHTQSSSVTLSGTSTLHDWKENSSKGTAEGTFVIANDKITGVSGLTFTLPAKSLKSEHTMMDNNTYKALNTDKNPNITYVVTSANVTPVDANTFTVKTTGRLTMAGTTKETEVVGTANVNADKSITVTGTKKFKMTDFSVTPPTVMFGSIKTGNDVTIAFNLKFVK